MIKIIFTFKLLMKIINVIKLSICIMLISFSFQLLSKKIDKNLKKQESLSRPNEKNEVALPTKSSTDTHTDSDSDSKLVPPELVRKNAEFPGSGTTDEASTKPTKSSTDNHTDSDSDSELVPPELERKNAEFPGSAEASTKEKSLSKNL